MEEQIAGLIEELKIKMIETLNLTDITPGDIDEDARLVGGDLGIDSIDVLEMVMMIEKEYSVMIDNKDVGIRVFETLKTLATYIAKKKK